jgi:hypothetical protein
VATLFCVGINFVERGMEETVVLPGVGAIGK